MQKDFKADLDLTMGRLAEYGKALDASILDYNTERAIDLVPEARNCLQRY